MAADTVPEWLVTAFGLFIALASLAGVVQPRKLTAMVMSTLDKPWFMPFAVGVRLVLGLLLLVTAAQSRFTGLFQVLGIFTLLAAALLPVIGKERVGSIMSWFNNSKNTVALRSMTYKLHP